MRKFEYCAHEIDLYKQEDGSFEHFRQRSFLNHMGSEGWELVSTESFDEHIETISVAPDEVVNEQGEIDYIDNGRRRIWKRDIKKIVLFFKREVKE